jgi:hypothetical protein
MPVKTGIQKTPPRPLNLDSGWSLSRTRYGAGMTKRGYNHNGPLIGSSWFDPRTFFFIDFAQRFQKV